MEKISWVEWSTEKLRQVFTKVQGAEIASNKGTFSVRIIIMQQIRLGTVKDYFQENSKEYLIGLWWRKGTVVRIWPIYIQHIWKQHVNLIISGKTFMNSHLKLRVSWKCFFFSLWQELSLYFGTVLLIYIFWIIPGNISVCL